MLGKTSVGDVYLRFHHTDDVIQINDLAKLYMSAENYMIWLTTEYGIKLATVCEVTYNDKMYSDASFCSEKDTPDRAQGRKIALARTLKQTSLTKEVRQEIWDTYFEKTKAFANVSIVVPAKLYANLEALAGTLDTDAVGALKAMLESCQVVKDVSLVEIEKTTEAAKEQQLSTETPSA